MSICWVVADKGPWSKNRFKGPPTFLDHQSVYPITGGCVADSIVDELVTVKYNCPFRIAYFVL